jgi:hypothetical protein
LVQSGVAGKSPLSEVVGWATTGIAMVSRTPQVGPVVVVVVVVVVCWW